MVTRLETERLVLRDIGEADVPALHGIMSDPESMYYWSSAPHTRIEQTRDYVLPRDDDDEIWPCWAVTLQGDTIGRIGLGTRRPGVRELGYMMARSHAGKGYAREAVAAVISYSFSDPATRRIFADIDPDNQPSIRVVEALGFVLEGRLRNEWETHLGERDSLIYGLLRGEWRG